MTTENSEPRQFTDELHREVEEVGRFFERTDLTPVESRVFALLLLSSPPDLDFFAIQRFLGASKSTISNALRRLMREGRVDYRTKPGDRKRYFLVSPRKWLQQIQDRFASIAPFVATMNRVLQFRQPEEETDFDRELREVQDYFRFLDEEMPRLRQRWEQQRHLRSAART
jgi:DNA-binding transcriptional regulator GbsR (MarR family)